ncbi:MAG: hypothetical protein HC859_03790 [Bacteroidia bacterium]|nr:hypothetical protein [Bacteroidia bacterium]
MDSKPDEAAYNPLQEAVDILIAMRDKIADDANLTWSYYESADQLRRELDDCIDGVRRSDKEHISGLGLYFYPACDMQTISIDNGWSGDYIEFASRYDQLEPALSGSFSRFLN